MPSRTCRQCSQPENPAVPFDWHGFCPACVEQAASQQLQTVQLQQVAADAIRRRQRATAPPSGVMVAFLAIAWLGALVTAVICLLVGMATAWQGFTTEDGTPAMIVFGVLWAAVGAGLYVASVAIRRMFWK